MLKSRHPAGIAIPYYKAIGSALLSSLLLIGCASQPAPQPQPEPAKPQPAQTQPLEPSTPAPQVKSSAPKTYVVKKGDTLWDISNMFLDDPWLWPEIWYVNPQIENPHLIYPGDIIKLIWVNGRAHLQIERNGQVVEATVPNVVSLSPEVHTQPLAEAIPTISLSALSPFIREARVVSEDELDNAPYVLRTVDGRLMAGEGTELYVRGDEFQPGQGFDVVRKQDPYIDPETGDVLGYAALRIGSGSITRAGDPATFMLRKSNREVLREDRLLPPLESLKRNFQPHAPDHDLKGQIIDVVDGVSQIGQFQVVVLNRGAEDGLDTGAVLKVMRRGGEYEDTVSGDDVALPDERVGLLMVFRSFDKVSFGLIMHATSEIHIQDVVATP